VEQHIHVNTSEFCVAAGGSNWVWLAGWPATPLIQNTHTLDFISTGDEVFDLNGWFTFAHSSCVFVPLCPNDFALIEHKDPKREETIMWASWRPLQLIKGVWELTGCNSNDIRLLKPQSFWEGWWGSQMQI
jgi:hypothetical protein